MTAEKSFRFARNVGWNLLGQIGVAAFNFLTLPYIVHRMGVDAYGLYILLHTAGSYLFLASFGASAATPKYVAAFDASKDGRGMSDTVLYAAAMHGLGVLIAAAILGLEARFFATRLFHLSPENLATGIFVIRCAAVAAVFAALLQFSFGVLQGLQYFDRYNLIVMIQSGLQPAGVAALLFAGRGIKAAACWYVALNMGLCLVVGAQTLRLLRPAMASSGAKGLRLKTFMEWSLTQWLGGLGIFVSSQFDKIFIARAISLSSLTLYSVPAGLLQRFQILPGMVSVVALPMMVEVSGPDSREALRRMYLKSVRFLLGAGLPTLVLMLTLIPQFLSLWLGGDFGSKSVQPTRLLVIGQLFVLLVTMPTTVVNTQSNPWRTPMLYWAQALTSVFLWRLLIPRYGILGVAIGTLAAQAVPTCVYIWIVHKKILHMPFTRYAAEGLWAPLCSAALQLCVIFPRHDAATSWFTMALFACAGYGVYYGSLWLLLNAEEKSLIRNYLRMSGFTTRMRLGV